MSQQDCSKTVRQLSAHKIREYRLIDSHRQLGGCVKTSLNPTRNARADTQGRRCQSIFTDFIFFIGRLSNTPLLIWLLTTPPHLKYVATTRRPSRTNTTRQMLAVSVGRVFRGPTLHLLASYSHQQSTIERTDAEDARDCWRWRKCERAFMIITLSGEAFACRVAAGVFAKRRIMLTVVNAKTDSFWCDVGAMQIVA